MFRLFGTAAATAGLGLSLLVSGAAFGSTVSKNLPPTVNQAFQGAGHVLNEAGRPIHNNVRDIGNNMEGGHSRKYGRIRHHHRYRHYYTSNGVRHYYYTYSTVR